MKKHSLLVLFCFVSLSAFCQSNKINKQDSVPYHFSIKNGWALKINALQPFVIGEFRIHLEKRITEYSAVELLGALYVPSLQYFYYKDKDESFNGQYSGSNNYKIGFGIIFYPIEQKTNFNIHCLVSYRLFEDTKNDLFDDIQPYFFTSQLNYKRIDSYRVGLMQITGNRKVTYKRGFAEFFIGVGLRTKEVKSLLIPNSENYSTITKDWKSYQETIALLYQPIHVKIFPTIQLGVNIGIQSK